MQIPVLVESVAGNGYRAKGAEPFALSAEGATREEALGKLKQQLENRLQTGSLVALDIGPPSHPWMEFAGMFKNDQDFKDVLDIMAANRRQMDEDDDIP